MMLNNLSRKCLFLLSQTSFCTCVGEQFSDLQFQCGKMGENYAFPLCLNDTVDLSQEIRIFALEYIAGLNLAQIVSDIDIFIY